MADKVVDSLAAASALLVDGKTTEANQMLVRLQQAEIRAAAIAGAPAPPPPPRTPQEVMVDLFDAITGLLGDHPSLKPLLNELKAVASPPPSAT